MYDDAILLKKNLTLWRNLSDIVSSLSVLRNQEWEMTTDSEGVNAFTMESRAYFSQWCFSLNTTIIPFSTFSIQPSSQVKEIEIQFDNKDLASRRQILVHNMNHEGAMMKYQNSSRALYMYTVELFEEVFIKEDLTKNCTDYPNAQYNSYKDCDLSFGLSTLAQNVGPDFMPLWASDDASKVTVGPVFFNVTSGYNTHLNLANGLRLSDCKMPCKIIKTKSKFQGSVASSASYGISVTFKKDIQVTTTMFVPFDPVKFLCDIGGILGLWLGLGAVQLGDMALHIIALGLKRIERTN